MLHTGYKRQPSTKEIRIRTDTQLSGKLSCAPEARDLITSPFPYRILSPSEPWTTESHVPWCSTLHAIHRWRIVR
jgi:hypothetical protein